MTVNGRPYADHPAPLHQVGALLDAKAVHTGRSAADHLRVMAATTGIGRGRVEEVIDLVGLREVADKRAGGFSLGMGQRLGIASALLGDPQTLILDEPVNGLDPEGVLWIRTLLTRLAAEGRTVFLSSHLMSEMALTAEHLIVIGRGRLIRDSRSTTSSRARRRTRCSSARPTTRACATAARRRHRGLGLRAGPAGGDRPDQRRDRLPRRPPTACTLLELSPVQASLEEAFMALTHDAVEYRSAPARATRW